MSDICSQVSSDYKKKRENRKKMFKRADWGTSIEETSGRILAIPEKVLQPRRHDREPI